MDKSQVILVMLRQPKRNRPKEKRTDPLWEFGSFGCTRCHRRNLMNPKKLAKLNGVRLGFAQNGHLGVRLVHVTPPVETRCHGTFGEAIWSPADMPLTYPSAPLLIDNDGKSDIPELWEEISDVRRRSAVGRFSSKFRSRRRPLEEPLGQKILSLYERVRQSTGCVSESYVDAMPYEPLCKDPNRWATYRELLGDAPPFEPRERARPRGNR